MFKINMQTKNQINKSYKKILCLSRNVIFYTKLHLKDTFQNRIGLIFLHFCFLIIGLKKKEKSVIYDDFYQNVYDLIFKNIEINMREIGYGDVTVNKNMKFLVKVFYDILSNCEDYSNKNLKDKNLFLHKHLTQERDPKTTNNIGLVKYFDKYVTFCLDLSIDSVLKCDFDFKIMNRGF